ncbi:MAG: hypothetical protein HC857_00100 [Synechococcales cyanobacterium RU_4_20]|nr:hypothetical protein [Synechococcales cyanobacterium RU_4_20]NJR67581.1 hypothetical protein [Synechococcales cyanobacterium CRU_2_2]
MAQNSSYPTIERFGSESQLKSYLVESAQNQYASLFGKPVTYYPPYYLKGSTPQFLAINFGTQVQDGATPSFFTGNASGGSSSRDFSQTNTQEIGVDEADLVETDGKFIYQVENQTLTIVDTRNPKEIKVTSQKSLQDLGNIEGAYLYGDKLTIVSTSPNFFYTYFGSYRSNLSDQPTVNVSVFDISNPYAIRIEETSKLDGMLLSSRAVGDKVYVATQDTFGLPAPESRPAWINGSVSSAKIAFPNPNQSYQYETKQAYLKRIQGKELTLALPSFITVDGQGKELKKGLLNRATDIYKPLDDKPYNMASVSVFDVDDKRPGPDKSIGLPANNVGNLYMSQDNLYLLRNDWWDSGKTGILKVDLDSLDWVARGEVAGRVLDPFSVDEEKGFLRVATTQGFGQQARNDLFVLAQKGQNLETIGSINNIAPGETIRSARFQDNYGFLVTFEQVDPFFSLDLSQPSKPKIAGEVKLPGFSEYLQVIENEGRKQVLGVGRDADASGRVRGLKLSLFDVQNLSQPKEVDSYLFEGQYSGSEAQWDQQAVGYYPKFDTLAIPFQSSVGGQGLRVFDVDAQDGFKVVGDIRHDGERIRRSLVIDDDLYAISGNRITVHDIKTLALIDDVTIQGATNPIWPVNTTKWESLALQAVTESSDIFATTL